MKSNSEERIDLKDFVSLTIRELIEAVEKAQSFAEEHNAEVIPLAEIGGTSEIYRLLRKSPYAMNNRLETTIDFDILQSI